MVGVEAAWVANGPFRWSRGSAPEELSRDERLLDELDAEGPALVRWYLPSTAAVVTGSAQRLRATELVDHERRGALGVDLLQRRAGGGLVLLNEGVLCLALALPRTHRRWCEDVTESYRWLGDLLAEGLRDLGVRGARRLDVQEARYDTEQLRADRSRASTLPREACFGGLSPHEVVVGKAKIVGLAQVRRRQGALYQAGILLRDQGGLADLVRTPDSDVRETFRALLKERTVGLDSLLEELPPVEQIARRLDAALRR